MNVATHNFEIFIPPRYVSEKFDRRTFNLARPDHQRTLYILRQIGRRRRFSYNLSFKATGWLKEYCDKIHWDKDNEHYRCCGSYALQYLPNDFMELTKRSAEFGDGERERYLDIGCGESPDALIAHNMGYDSVAVDLFPPDNYNHCLVRADAVGTLPFADYSFDYVSSQAMIALVPLHERMTLYRNIYRVMKIGATFSLIGSELKCGYGFKQGAEVQRARILPWHVESTVNGFRAIRESE